MADKEILDKLGKLKAHMDSCKAIGSEAEAEAFAGMLNRLLARHKLEMTDIQYSFHLKEEPVEEVIIGGEYKRSGRRWVYSKFPDVEIGKKRVEWAERLAQVIAEAHSCQMLVITGSSRLVFVGRKTDIEVAEYLFFVMMRTADTLSNKAYKRIRSQLRREANGDKQLTSALLAETHGYKQSFLLGFISRIHERFQEEKRKIEHDTSRTALIRLSYEVLAVRDYLAKKKFKGADRLSGRTKNFNEDGYEHGRKVADGLGLRANAMSAGEDQRRLK